MPTLIADWSGGCTNKVTGPHVSAEEAFQKADQKITGLTKKTGDATYVSDRFKYERKIGLLGDVTIRVSQLWGDNKEHDLLVVKKNCHHHIFGNNTYDYSVQRVTLPSWIYILKRDSGPFVNKESLWYNAAMKCYAFLLDRSIEGSCPTA